MRLLYPYCLSASRLLDATPIMLPYAGLAVAARLLAAWLAAYSGQLPDTPTPVIIVVTATPSPAAIPLPTATVVLPPTPIPTETATVVLSPTPSPTEIVTVILPPTPTPTETATAVPPPAPTPTETSTAVVTPSQVVILAVDLRGEVVTIVNLGGAPQSMAGWTLVSEAGGQSFRFPDGFTLAPGATVLVTSGPNGYLAPQVVLQWLKSDGTPSGGYVWNNDGDTAVLRDAAGNTVSRFP